MAVKEKRGLGIGLEALFGTELQMLEDEEVLTLPITRVEPRQDQPRDHFDEERLQDLAASISRHGLIQPVIVRKLDSGDYQIIAGERRWRAARLAGLAEIPVRVLRADDQSVAELALVENLQREDLNPMEEARGYQKLMQDYALTQEEAAAGVGKSRSAVANALRLLNLSAPVSEMVESGVLSAGHARTLLALWITPPPCPKSSLPSWDGESLFPKRTIAERLSSSMTMPTIARHWSRFSERSDPEHSGDGFSVSGKF